MDILNDKEAIAALDYLRSKYDDLTIIEIMKQVHGYDEHCDCQDCEKEYIRRYNENHEGYMK